jgi:hypothetical protein
MMQQLRIVYNATIKHGEYQPVGRGPYVSESVQLQDATQSIKTALSGSSYILSDVTRGNGVQTYNMKKELIWFSRKFYG